MVWVVDKKIVRHVVEHDGRFAEVPIRVSFEFELTDGTVIDNSLSIDTLYNQQAVCKAFPTIDATELEEDVQRTVHQAIDEHLSLSGFEHNRVVFADDSDPEADP